MARVNLEERFFAEASRLARVQLVMGWDRRSTIGMLVDLWHESQSASRIDGDAEEIADWALVYEPDLRPKVLPALLKAGYIHAIGDGRYEIHGNREQLEGLAKHEAWRRKGGEATKAKWLRVAQRSVDNQGLEPSSEACLDQAYDQAKGRLRPGTIQCNTIQDNTDTVQQTPAPPDPADESAGPVKEKLLRKKPAASDFDLRLAREWADHAKTISPHLKPRMDTYADAIRLMRTVDHMTEAQVEYVLKFIKANKFWSDKAVSPVRLREAGDDGHRKLDTIVAQIKAQKNGSSSPSAPSKLPDLMSQVAAQKECK